jgi:hypothetical protein
VKALRKEGIFYPRFRFAFAQAKIAFVTHDFFGYFFLKKSNGRILCEFFCLNTKEPKSQGCAEKAKIFFSSLKEKSKPKAALLRQAATDLAISADNSLSHPFLFDGLRKKFLSAFSTRPVNSFNGNITSREFF